MWHGAVRSGKTVGSLFAFLMRVAEAPTQGEIVIIGRTRDTVFRNLIGPLLNESMFGGFTEHIVCNRGAPTATILGRTVHVIGASDVRAEAIIRGMTINTSYVDELTLVAEDFMSQLMARHSVDGAWLGATTNPDAPGHYVKAQYIDRAAEMGHRIFHFTLDDNRKYLKPGYIDGLEKQHTGIWRDRFIRGLWTMADGMVFDAFDTDRHVVDELPTIVRTLSVGMDYGTTNPTSGIMLGIGDDHRLYAIAEWAPPQGVDAALSKSLQAWLAPLPQPEYLFVDPAAASFKLQLRTDGLSRIYNADNDVLAGIRTVSSLLATGQLLIHSSCTNLLREIPGYVWDKKASEKGEDKPVKLNDHHVDALRYAVASARRFWEPELRQEVTL